MNRQTFVITMVLATIVLLSMINPFVPFHVSDTLYDRPKDFVMIADGESWLTGWDYRQSHTINGSAGAGTNYPVKILVEYGSGSSAGDTIYCGSNVMTTFEDIRFTDNDGDTLLDYWLEEKTDSDDATFWVEVADNLDTAQVVYVYYGNDGQPSLTDGDAVFLFFDDFEDEDFAEWATAGGYWSTVNDRVQYGSFSAFGDAGATLNDRKLFADISAFGDADFMVHMWAQRQVETSREYYFRSGDTDAGSVYALMANSGNDFEYHDGGYNHWEENTAVDDTWIRLEVALDITNDLYKFWRNRGYVDSSSLDDTTGAKVIDMNNWEFYTDTGAGEDMWLDDVYARNWVASEPVHHVWGSEEEVNVAPINDSAPSCTNLDDTDFLYAQYTLYEFDVSVTDVNGYADIDYVQLISYDFNETTVRWAVTFDQDTSQFTEDAGTTTIDLVTGSCTYSESGINLDITFKLYIEWAHLDVTDDDLKQTVIDGSAVSDEDLYDVNYNYETRLDFTTGPTIYDGVGTSDRGDINDVLIMGTVAVKYYGTAFHYPDDSEIDVWASCADVSGGANPTPWDDLVSIDNIYYLAMASDDVVGLDTYTFIVVSEGLGSASTDLCHTTHTDTYIADRVQVQSYSASDARQSINVAVNIDATLDYDYDDSDVTDGTVTIDGHSASHQGSGVWRITRQTNVPSLITYDTVVAAGNVHGITEEDQNGQSQGVIWDRVNLTLSGNYGWSVIGYNVTLSATGVFEYDSAAWSGVVTWDAQFPVESTANIYGYGASRITSITDPTHGVVAFQVGEQASIVFDDGEVSSVAYYWVQYSVNSVWLIYQTGTWTWVINGTTLDTGTDDVCIIQSEMNNTDDDWAIMDATGDIGDLIVGQFDTSWYYVVIDLMCETTIGGRVFDWEVQSTMLDVDIMHSIHITDSGMNIQDDWITFYFHTNWNNATFTIWNNRTGSGIEVGYSSSEGWYQIAKDATVGIHWYWILVNGSHSGSSSVNQTFDPTDVGDDWEWLNFKVTVNPITFSITDIYVMQNNASIIVGGIFNTGDLSIDYTIYEDGVYLSVGTVNIPSSGDYYVIKWSKSSATSVANWTLVMSAGTNITIYGYNLFLDDATYITNSSGQWINNDYIIGESIEVAVARATETMWDTIGLILVILIIPVVAGIAVKADRAKGRKGKRDKANDKYRTNE